MRGKQYRCSKIVAYFVGESKLGHFRRDFGVVVQKRNDARVQAQFLILAGYSSSTLAHAALVT